MVSLELFYVGLEDGHYGGGSGNRSTGAAARGAGWGLRRDRQQAVLFRGMLIEK